MPEKLELAVAHCITSNMSLLYHIPSISPYVYLAI